MKKSILLFSMAIFFFNTMTEAATWSQDVAPILYARCTACHHSGGLAPMPLLTYADAFNNAFNIYNDVLSKKMPPWPPDENYKHFAHERVLTQAEVDTIANWYTGGKLQGNITLAPAQPTYSNGSKLGTVDLSVRIPAYSVGSNVDVYRNFPIPSGLISGKYITAVEVIPGNSQIVHHVLIFQDSTNIPLQLDNADPGFGYTNAGGTGSLASKLIAGYTPGASPYYTPVGTGFRLPANTNIVVQVHYPAGSMGLVDSTRINFKLTSTPQREITVFPLVNHLQNINSSINIPAGSTRTYYEQYTTGTNYTFLSAFPHMHLIGRTIKSWANKTTAPFDTIRFEDVPDWDFHWQDTYVFPNALNVPSGYKIQAVATYDNTTNNPNHLSQTVVAGESTTDEMMMVFLSFMNYQSGDENLIIDRRVIPQGATTFCSGQSVILKTIEGVGYTYQWYKDGAAISNATSFSYAASQAGNYHVKIFLGPNNSLSDTVAISVSSAPTAAIAPSGTSVICNGSSLTLNASTGSGYSYQWYNNGTPITNAISSSYSATAAGSYTVQIYNGCYANSNTVTTTIASAPSNSVTLSGPITFCQGGSLTLTAAPGLTYHWSNGATTSAITVYQGNAYSVTVSNANNCSAASVPATVTVNSLPNTTITTIGATTFCQGGSVTLNAPAALSYHWNTNATSQGISPTQSGPYMVTVTNANNCSAVSSPVSVTVNSLPDATVVAGGATTFCQGGGVVLNAATGLTYHWNNNATTQQLTVIQGGSYIVTVTNTNNCTAASSPTVITVNSLPDATVTPSGSTTICQGGSVSLNAASGLAYHWSTNATTRSISVTQNGPYSVTVTNPSNCSAASSAVTVTVNPLPSATITPNGATSFCDGGGVVLQANSNSSYRWNNNATSQSITASQSGNYSVTVTSATNCSNTASVSVTEYAVPDTTITADKPTTICPGDSVTLSAAAGLSYHWSNNTTARSITVNASGNFSVTVSDTHSCSAVSSLISVSVSNNAVAGITASGPTTFCDGGSVGLSASNGTAFLWNNNATTQSITALTDGTYVVTVTVSGNCTAISNPVTVTVNQNPALPAITASGSTTFCEGDSVNLSAPPGYNYLWSLAETTQTVTIKQTGSYMVTITNINSCAAASNAMAILVNALPSVTLSGNADTLCTSSAPILLAGGIPSGGAYSGAAVTAGYFNPAAAGAGNHIINYSYTDNHSCHNIASENIAVEICTGIAEMDLMSYFISPNPSNGTFEIEIKGQENLKTTMEVVDISGKLIYSSVLVNTKTEIMLKGIPSGCYMLILKTEQGSVHRKLMVQ